MLAREFSFFDFPAQLEGARVAVLGLPFDGTSSGTPGSREAPVAIRTVSNRLEDYSPVADRDIWGLPIADVGDVELPHGNTHRVLELIREHAEPIVQKGIKPLSFGGEHLCSLPLIELLVEKYPDLVILQFDAHTDLREEFLGERYSHATVIYHALQKLRSPDSLISYGIRSGSKEEFELLYKTRFCAPPYAPPSQRLRQLERHLQELAPSPLYITFDLDVFDPSILPATGTPEAGGIFFDEFIQAIRILREYPAVVGADVVELCPPLDHTKASTLLAANVAKELALLLVG